MAEAVTTLLSGNKHLAPRAGTSFLLRKGQTLTIIDPKGSQVADLLVFNAADTRETLSNGRTFDYNQTIALSTGSNLYSNRSNVLLRIVEDTVGVHDFLITPCSTSTFRLLYGDDRELSGARSCFDNLAFVLERYGIADDQIPVPFNCFMNVHVEAETGRLEILPPVSKAGGFVRFVAEMDLIVALTACAAARSNGYVCKEVEYRIG